MLPGGLHPDRWNGPQAFLKVELFPISSTDFSRPRGCKNEELERSRRDGVDRCQLFPEIRKIVEEKCWMMAALQPLTLGQEKLEVPLPGSGVFA